MSDRIPVVVLAATGSVGQRFVQLLDNHPYFDVVALTGSDRTSGQVYGEACHWVLSEPMPSWAAKMPVLATSPEAVPDNFARLAFSALPADVARTVEPDFASQGTAVFSNASAFRTAPDVPILMPEVNPEHAGIVAVQRRARGWKGFITTNPNCTATGMTVALKALDAAFGVEKVFAVSLQAISGAGYPGVASLDILDNAIPIVGGEEAKVEWEPRKMLGSLTDDAIVLADMVISAHTNRVAVSDGHLVCLSVGFKNRAEIHAVTEALQAYQAPAASRDLPSSPHPVILVRSEADRPQPRLDRMTGKGMTTVVGRIRPDPLLDVRLVVLSHNTIRGAAGGSIYNAELFHNLGLL